MFLLAGTPNTSSFMMGLFGRHLFFLSHAVQEKACPACGFSAWWIVLKYGHYSVAFAVLRVLLHVFFFSSSDCWWGYRASAMYALFRISIY